MVYLEFFRLSQRKEKTLLCVTDSAITAVAIWLPPRNTYFTNNAIGGSASNVLFGGNRSTGLYRILNPVTHFNAPTSV